MSGACPVVAGPDTLVTGLFALVDCRADLLARGGFLGLSGSTLYASLVTGLLTILVAIQGYRMLVGIGPTLPGVTGTILRIGFVLALTGSWTAYDAVIGKVALRGPGEIAALTLPGAGLGGEGLAGRLQNYYDAIRTPPPPTAPPSDAPQSIQDARAEAASQGRVVASDTPGMIAGTTQERETAANWFVAGTVGPLLAMRVAISLLLALGPLAIVSLLFESTDGIFAAWLRTLAGAGLAWIGVTAAVALELEALDGPLTTAISAQSYTVPGVLPILCVFLLIKAVLVFAIFRVMNGWRSLHPWRAPASTDGAANGMASEAPTLVASNRTGPGQRGEIVAPAASAAPRTQVHEISAVLEASVRRERGGSRDGASHVHARSPAAGGLGTRAHDRSAHRRPARIRMKALT